MILGDDMASYAKLSAPELSGMREGDMGTRCALVGMCAGWRRGRRIRPGG